MSVKHPRLHAAQSLSDLPDTMSNNTCENNTENNT